MDANGDIIESRTVILTTSYSWKTQVEDHIQLNVAYAIRDEAQKEHTQGHGTVKLIEEWKKRQVCRPYVLALSGSPYEVSPSQLAGYYSVMADGRWTTSKPPRRGLSFLVPEELKKTEAVFNTAIRAARKAQDEWTAMPSNPLVEKHNNLYNR